MPHGLRLVVWSVILFLIFAYNENYCALLLCFWKYIFITNIIFLSFQQSVSSFYSAQPRTSRRLAARALEERRTLSQYVVPPDSAASDMEVEDDTLEELDNDDVDPDFIFDIQDENLTPTTSGKQ